MPGIPVAIVSGIAFADTIQSALALGAAAFIPKSASPEVISVALASVLAGDTWFASPADASRWSYLSSLDPIDENLTPFQSKGGKIIMAHGTVDQTVSPRATEFYYQTLQANMGVDAVNSFMAFYEIPGLQHAFSTVFNPAWDNLTALENWVESGTAPTNQVASDTVGVPGRTRPLCQYPSFPRYSGSGDVNSAASFTCSMQ